MSELTKKTEKLEHIQRPNFEATPVLRPFIDQLRKSSDPRDQVLAQLAESSDINRQETQWQTPILIDTHFQTNKTNGRVTRIEFLLTVGKIVGTTCVVILAVLAIKDPAQLAELYKIFLP